MPWVPGPRSHRELRHAGRWPPSRVVPQREELREGGQDHRGTARGEGCRHCRITEDAGEVEMIFLDLLWIAYLSLRGCVKLALATTDSQKAEF